MMIARWHVEARFGYKQKAIDLLLKWEREIGPKAGIAQGTQQIITGSVGAREAEIQLDMKVKDLAELDTMFSRIGKAAEHGPWGAELEPFIVSGSTYWEVFRVIQ